jgi:hypothetical protein
VTPDEKAVEAGRRAARQLSTLVRERPEDVAASLAPFAQTKLTWPEPSPEAWRLAIEQASDALPLARRELELYGHRDGSDLRSGTEREAGNRPQPYDATSPFTDAGLAVGLPLVEAINPVLFEHVQHWVAARAQTRKADRTGKPAPLRYADPKFRAHLANALTQESTYWSFAQGGPLEIAPYAFRYSATRWVWHPDIHSGARAQGICLRCGTLITRDRPPTVDPLCPHCMSETHRRTWPNHAIAPAGQGTWWLRCQRAGCTYKGRAQSRHCDQHKTANLTTSRRAA